MAVPTTVPVPAENDAVVFSVGLAAIVVTCSPVPP